MGLVADGGPTAVLNYTGWYLKDSGMGNFMPHHGVITSYSIHYTKLYDTTYDIFTGS